MMMEESIHVTSNRNIWESRMWLWANGLENLYCHGHLFIAIREVYEGANELENVTI